MSRLIMCIMVILIAGCSGKQEVPKDVMSPEKMEKVMWDMLQADRFATGFIAPKKDSAVEERKEILTLYENVFQLHGITHDEFVNSYKFYLSRPDLFKQTFDSIALGSESKRTEAYKSRVTINRDSLRRHRDSLSPKRKPNQVK